MAYRYRSRRTVQKIAKKSRRNFIITLIVISLLIYATLNWVLPYFIGGIGVVKNRIDPPKKITGTKNLTLAPPVLNIPIEATNSAEINIKGFGVPNSKVKIYVDDDLKETVDVSSEGSFIAENILLNIGTNNIYGKTLDENAKESLASKTIILNYSYDKPNLAVNQPEDDSKIQGGDKKITVSGKTGDKIKIYINDSQVVVNKDGNFTSELSINEGENIITVKAVDVASNTTEIQRKVTYIP